MLLSTPVQLEDSYNYVGLWNKKKLYLRLQLIEKEML